LVGGFESVAAPWCIRKKGENMEVGFTGKGRNITEKDLRTLAKQVAAK